MSPRLPTPSTAAAITSVARLPVNPTRSEGMPRSCVIAGRFNDRSVGSTAATTNGIEVARTIMKVENVHLGRVCAAVVIAPPYSLPLTHWGILPVFLTPGPQQLGSSKWTMLIPGRSMLARHPFRKGTTLIPWREFSSQVHNARALMRVRKEAHNELFPDQDPTSNRWFRRGGVGCSICRPVGQRDR